MKIHFLSSFLQFWEVSFMKIVIANLSKSRRMIIDCQLNSLLANCLKTKKVGFRWADVLIRFMKDGWLTFDHLCNNVISFCAVADWLETIGSRLLNPSQPENTSPRSTTYLFFFHLLVFLPPSRTAKVSNISFSKAFWSRI